MLMHRTFLACLALVGMTSPVCGESAFVAVGPAVGELVGHPGGPEVGRLALGVEDLLGGDAVPLWFGDPAESDIAAAVKAVFDPEGKFPELG